MLSFYENDIIPKSRKVTKFLFFFTHMKSEIYLFLTVSKNPQNSVEYSTLSDRIKFILYHLHTYNTTYSSHQLPENPSAKNTIKFGNLFMKNQTFYSPIQESRTMKQYESPTKWSFKFNFKPTRNKNDEKLRRISSHQSSVSYVTIYNNILPLLAQYLVIQKLVLHKVV